MHDYTIADYVDLETHTNVKHELIDGEIYAMTGGTPNHALLIANAMFQLQRAAGVMGCRVFSSDLRIRVPGRNVILYPDASVVCGKPEMDTEDPMAIRNPRLILEVTSRSSCETDRGEKYEHYQHLPSLREYIVVSHEERRVEVFRRNDNQWALAATASGGELELDSLASTIDIDAIYQLMVIPIPSPHDDGPSA
ncbi:MAG TPA: Uma2 family endonuclease [Kofleriaceae bacterium]|nr:Uma2 family endonuclease [Kofleriaceae bacterium]